jgi:hypothetical protein
MQKNHTPIIVIVKGKVIIMDMTRPFCVDHDVNMHGDQKWIQSPNLWQFKIFNYQTYGD